MLIIGLVAAACLYAILYWIYLMAESQMTGSMTTLAIINKMLFVSDPIVFFLFRWLILLTLFYVIVDAIVSPARRGLRNMKQRRIDAKNGKTIFRGAKPAAPPPPDDDLAPHY